MNGITVYNNDGIKFFRSTYGYAYVPESINSDFTKLLLGAIDMVWISQTVLDEIVNKKRLDDERNALLSRTANRNNEGKWHEENGNIDKAISLYEENVIEGYPATLSFERLYVLYRKRRQYQDELRVLDVAIQIFSKENEEGFKRITEKPENAPYKDALQIALETCTPVKNDEGWYIFCPYPVIQYIERREKVLKLIEKQGIRKNKI